MTSPHSSPNLSVKQLVASQVLRDQRRVVSYESGLPQAIIHNPSSSPDLILPDIPDSSEDMSEHMPLLSPSMVGSTPYSFKMLKSSLPSSDPFDTPSHTESSVDHSFNTPSTAPNSNSSTSMEIFLGPQPLSYIHHRNRLLPDDFDRSPCRPTKEELASIKFKGGSSNNTSTHDRKQEAAEEGEDKSAPPMSKWRQEQIKKFKPGRPVPGSRERPIPVLHGPLSLPYARNPSGVDATVADQSSHMSHVFGLRAVPSPEGKQAKAAPPPRSRIVSDSTTSVASAGRNVSGPSYVSSASENLSASQSSFGSTKRPLVARDYNQVIGIKKDLLLDTGVDGSRLRPPEHHQTTDLRAHLGLGKPLSPIPGSPSKVSPIMDAAIHSASSAVWPQEDLVIKPEFVSLALVDPITHLIYNVKVPKVASSAGASGGVTCEILPTGAKITPPGQSSKADTSANWRNKFTISPGIPSSPVPNVAPPSTPAKDSPRPQVLTVDHLYEKFAHKKSELTATSNVPSPAPPRKAASKPAASKTPSTKMLSDSTGRQTNIQVDSAGKQQPIKKKVRSAPSPTKGRSVTAPYARSKGTPGAGKLLKRPVSVDPEDTPSKTSV